MKYEPVIGLEVHAELATRTKMFCGCMVVDTTRTAPNTSVCPVCTGMPGTLPVLNHRAVEYGLRVALALESEVQMTSIFARKNYFYPDLPKGYQISQYEKPLARNGRLTIETASGDRNIRIRRVHLEEDTGKLTHVSEDGEEYSLVDLNRAGVPLLEIVSEPDMHSLEDVRAYATQLRAILRELGVNTGDMEKGVIRFEANVSIRSQDSQELGTRVEIKNLNSFRSMERGIAFELGRQAGLIERGEAIQQETMGWDDSTQSTYSQRSKEEAHDYRYFPEPDLPPLVIDSSWVEEISTTLPELPRAKTLRLQKEYDLSRGEAAALASEREVCRFFEDCVALLKSAPPRAAAKWILGEVYAWINQVGCSFSDMQVTAGNLAELLEILQRGEVNLFTAKSVFSKMLITGKPATQIITEEGLEQVSDQELIAELVAEVLAAHPAELSGYLAGKESLSNWFFGSVMKKAGGKANPTVVKAELQKQFDKLKIIKSSD